MFTIVFREYAVWMATVFSVWRRVCHLSSCAALLWKYLHVMVMAKTETEGAMYYYYYLHSVFCLCSVYFQM